MFIQIEITTVCNFQCFYCAGRGMPATHMDRVLFDRLIAGLPAGRHVVSLQGEGEPLAHPHFFEMAAQVRRAGHRPHLITNCSLPGSRELHKAVPTIGISLDTVDPLEAERIGRKGLKRVLANFEHLVAIAGGKRIVVHSVDFGQDWRRLQEYLLRLGVRRHVVQPLQAKEDYLRRYRDRVPTPPVPTAPFPCAYLSSQKMLFFNIDGLAMPCCFIKDASRYVSEAALRSDFSRGNVPKACAGCRKIGGGRS